jgi:hypothetical protein
MPKPVFILQGSSMSLKIPQTAQPACLAAAVRGDILPYMSRGSRRGLMNTFSHLDLPEIARLGLPVWFLTLTLPKEYWDKPDFTKAGLKRYRERFNYHFKGRSYLGSIVRRELGPSGNMHYHSFMVGPKVEWTELSPWVLENWRECLRYGTLCARSAEYVQIDLQQAENPEAVAKYVGKYMTKAAYDGSKWSTAATKDSLFQRNEEKGTPGAVCTSLFNVHNAASEDENAENKDNSGKADTGEGESLPMCVSLTNAHNSRKWGRHWTVWERETLPWAEQINLQDDGEQALSTAVKAKRVYRKWLQRQDGVKLLREFKESNKDINIAHWMGGEGKAQEKLRGMRRNEVRQAWRKGKKVPYFEYLRTSGKVGYTLYLSEHFRDNLISWALGEAASFQNIGTIHLLNEEPSETTPYSPAVG